MKRELCFAFACAFSVWIALLPTTARAAPTYTVDSTLDQVDDDVTDGVCHTAAGTCTLRAAVMTANRVTGPGATIIVPAGTYLLTRPVSGTDGDDNGNLNLATPSSGNPVISITGAGSALTVIDANQIDNVIRVEAGRSASISDITVRNGYTTGNGGGIENNGTLTLIGIVARANQARDGGGVSNIGQLRVSANTLAENTATDIGGGLFNATDAVIVQSTLTANTAGSGGGVGTFRNLTLINSTLSQNTAVSAGGGLYKDEVGGQTEVVSLYSASVIANRASDGGGLAAASGVINVRNILIAGNQLSDASTYDDCDAILLATGFNLLWAQTAFCTITGSAYVGALNSLQLIGPLQDNGGPTFTHALLPGSNAIDAVDAAQCVDADGNLLLTDQRGYPRVFGVRCDVGAFEVGDTIFRNGFE